MVNESEMEDFRNIITDRNIDANDFSIQEKEDPITGTGIQPITGTITIRRKFKGKEKTYKVGHGSTWTAEFSDDLNCGIFD